MITENTPGIDPANDIIDSPAQEQEAPVPAALPVPTPEVTRRNQHLKVNEPKNKQFTGRATEKEEARIKRAIEVRKQQNPECTDIVRLCLALLDYIEADWLQTFKTK